MITDLKIKNFRSLKDVALTGLQPVNLLIGPNNSGKSNILKALKFFSEFLEGNMPTEMQLEPLFFNSLSKKIYNIQNESIDLFLFSNKGITNDFGEISIQHFNANQKENKRIPPFAIFCANSKKTTEEFHIANVDSLDKAFDDFAVTFYNYLEIIKPTSFYGYELDNILPKHFTGEFDKLHSDRTFTNSVSDPSLGFFRNLLQNMTFSQFKNLKIYRPEPSKLLEQYPIQSEQTVNEDASNLVDFLITMSFRYKSIFQRITDDLQRFVPEFKEINFNVIKEPLKSIQEKYPNKSLAILGLTDIHERTFWADSLSEGTLYFLSLLCIIHQPEPPQLLLLEEPEKGIHPRRIRETMRLIFELAEEKNIQVILTTHSTTVVDTFADMPEAVYIVERNEQATTIKNLQRDIINPHSEQFKAAGEEPIPFTDALGEYWEMGFLGGVPNENY